MQRSVTSEASVTPFNRSKEARTARRNEISAENDLFEEAEGILFGPGIADWS